MKFIFAATFLLLLGCNQSSDSKEGHNFEPSELIGAWVTECQEASFEDIPEEIWSITTITITNETIEKIADFFDDEGCEIAYSGNSNLFVGFRANYSYLYTVNTSINNYEAGWLELSNITSISIDFEIPLDEDHVDEVGYYIDEDTLQDIVDIDGEYVLSLTEYHKQ
ncbi:MAG: hypothetical protein D6B28_07205 [Gammaproteobacteria bacterium]|nr:MAG: hypothetical protein D6B28_07205 [Gammaproteobacteria bacterium]